MMKLLNIVGARPQFIKLTAICRAIDRFNQRSHRKRKSQIRQILLHTGQHYDYAMDTVFFKQLQIPKPDYNLGVGSASQARQTGLMLERAEKVLKKEKPDLVLVYGDTNSTLAGALAVRKLNILLAHVEAGLRAYNLQMPEEVNRVIVDRISDVLFCPSCRAVSNLSSEGIVDSRRRKFPKVFLSGDVMYDAVLFYLDFAKQHSDVLQRLSLSPRSYYLATVHRAENTENPARLRSILSALNALAKITTVIFPMHPRTRKAASLLKIKSLRRSLRIIKPVSYLDMLLLEQNAKAVLTDSGGVQKEAFFLGRPCITLRDETEWVETVELGFNILAGTEKNSIKRALSRVSGLIKGPPQVYGNGRASERIVKIIKSL